MQRNRLTGRQQATKLVLYEIFQQLAESESDESEYETSDTFFSKKEKLFLIPENLMRLLISLMIALSLHTFVVRPMTGHLMKTRVKIFKEGVPVGSVAKVAVVDGSIVLSPLSPN